MRLVLAMTSALLFLSTITGCSQASAPTAPAAAHTEVGNGGDPLSLEFADRAHFVLDYLAAHPGTPPLLTHAQLQAFERAIHETPIELTDEKLVDNQGVPETAVVRDAPELGAGRKKILLQRERWLRRIEESLEHRGFVSAVRLVLHEYLRVLSIDDDGYAISSKLEIADSDYRAWRGKIVGFEEAPPDVLLPNPSRDASLGGSGVLWIGGYLVDSARIALAPDGGFYLAKGYSPSFGATWNRFSISHYFEWGGLDRDFGVKGKAEGSDLVFPNFVQFLLVQKNGSLVVVVGNSTADTGAQLWRFDRHGKRDDKFTERASPLSKWPFRLQSAKLTADDAIVLVGDAPSKKNPKQRKAILVRYLADGTPDPTLPGKVMRLEFSGGEDAIQALAIDSQGRYVIAGTAEDRKNVIVSRMSPNGEPDKTFADGGIIGFKVPSAAVVGLALDHDGKIIVAANHTPPASWPQGFLFRLSPDGQLDESFGKKGFFQPNERLKLEMRDVILDHNDQIVLAGYSHRSPPTVDVHFDLWLARLTPNGSDGDLRYGVLGYAPVQFPGAGPPWVAGLTIDDKNRLLVTGWTVFRGWGIERERPPETRK